MIKTLLDQLKVVALRNAELYFEDKQKFETKMFWLGWKPSEVEQMKMYIESNSKEG